MLGALVAAGATSALADAGWQPPSGWTAAPANGGMIAVWLGKRHGNFTPNINVIWDRAFDVEAEAAAALRQFQRLDVEVTSTPVACALGAGIRVEYKAYINGLPVNALQYYAPDGAGGTYVASYSRLAADAPEAPAVAAIRGICEHRRPGLQTTGGVLT